MDKNKRRFLKLATGSVALGGIASYPALREFLLPSDPIRGATASGLVHASTNQTVKIASLMPTHEITSHGEHVEHSEGGMSMQQPEQGSLPQTQQGKVYLTLDDGWKETQRVFDIAKQYQVPLGLFIIGQVIERNPKIWQYAIEQGHEVLSHTYAHKPASTISPQVFLEDLRKFQSIVVNKLGTEAFNKIHSFRFPYGDKGKKVQRDEITKIIHNEFGWDISWWNHDLSRHPKNMTVEGVASDKQIDAIKRRGGVVLLHFSKFDAEVLEKLIVKSLSKGIKFGALSEIAKKPATLAKTA